MRHMRELSQPEVLDRRVREDWETRGGDGPLRPLRSRRRARSSREYRPEPVPDDVAARIHAIVEETDVAVGVA